MRELHTRAKHEKIPWAGDIFHYHLLARMIGSFTPTQGKKFFYFEGRKELPQLVLQTHVFQISLNKKKYLLNLKNI